MQDLIDKDAIRDLVMLYSRGVDRQDFALLRTLYTPDAMEDNHGGLYKGSAEGYVDWLMTVMPRLGITAHGIQHHLIGLDSETTGQGEVYMTAYHRLPAEKGSGWIDLIHGMRYLDHYRKLDGKWLFARRSVSIDWQQRSPCMWDTNHPDIAGSLFGTHEADDPSYAVLGHPLFARHG